MALEGFDSFSFTHEGASRTVYRRGSGPAVGMMRDSPPMLRMSPAAYSALRATSVTRSGSTETDGISTRSRSDSSNRPRSEPV